VLLSLAIACVLAIAVSGAQGSTDARAGGIFKVSLTTVLGFDHIDPALANSRDSWTLLDTVCARLMRYRDSPPPAGYTLVPEVAAAPPTVSDDGRTYTFRLRTGFRFSDGRPVDAHAFAQAIHRTMAPGVDSPAWLYSQAIVGADDVKAGRSARATGISARGLTLTVRFTRTVGDFAAWTTMPFFCAVPPNLPPSAEGVRTFPGAGPYVIREYRPNQRVTIRRNPYYGGTRAHHVNGFDVDLTASSAQEVLERVERGKADWGYTLASFAVNRGLIGRYHLNERRFWIDPGLTVSMYVINSSGPLFQDNPRLRKAVNLALDRTRFVIPTAFGVATDQLLPPSVSGFQEREIYPLTGDLDRAKALAAGNLRGGKAILYAPDAYLPLRSAQALVDRLALIGLEVEIQPFGEHATGSAHMGRLGNPDEKWDLGLVLWTPDFVDPAGYINRLLDAQHAGGTGLARFDEPEYLDLMRRAARLQGAARARAYADLELKLVRDAAPLLPVFVFNEATFVSARVPPRCLLRRPSLVLTTVCLERVPS
jgi:peptide/nickel transport system substrate-binding protein/oligopeptide transport system substrate-binding protein